MRRSFLFCINFGDKKQAGESQDCQEEERSAIGRKINYWQSKEWGDDISERAGDTEKTDKAGVLFFNMFEKVAFGGDFNHTCAYTSAKKNEAPNPKYRRI